MPRLRHLRTWRWHTLAAVTTHLCRLEGAVRAAMGALRNSAELGSRDSTHAQAVWQAVNDEDFWAKARGLRMLVNPFKDLRNWIRGCPCHEAEILRGPGQLFSGSPPKVACGTLWSPCPGLPRPG